MALSLSFPGVVVSVLEWAWSSIVWRGPATHPVIYLTFDDGPDPLYTPQVLDILRSNRVTATFFVVGEEVQRHPGIVHRICADGHEIASHSTSTSRTLSLSPAAFEADVVANETILSPFPCFKKAFRPAGGFIRLAQREVLAKHGYRCILGSAYAFDPSEPPASFIAWAVNRALSPGAIIVLHDSGGDRSRSVRALQQIIDGARRKGLQFGKVSSLLVTQ